MNPKYTQIIKCLFVMLIALSGVNYAAYTDSSLFDKYIQYGNLYDKEFKVAEITNQYKPFYITQGKGLINPYLYAERLKHTDSKGYEFEQSFVWAISYKARHGLEIIFIVFLPLAISKMIRDFVYPPKIVVPTLHEVPILPLVPLHYLQRTRAEKELPKPKRCGVWWVGRYFILRANTTRVRVWDVKILQAERPPMFHKHPWRLVKYIARTNKWYMETKLGKNRATKIGPVFNAIAEHYLENDPKKDIKVGLKLGPKAKIVKTTKLDEGGWSSGAGYQQTFVRKVKGKKKKNKEDELLQAKSQSGERVGRKSKRESMERPGSMSEIKIQDLDQESEGEVQDYSSQLSLKYK